MSFMLRNVYCIFCLYNRVLYMNIENSYFNLFKFYGRWGRCKKLFFYSFWDISLVKKYYGMRCYKFDISNKIYFRNRTLLIMIYFKENSILSIKIRFCLTCTIDLSD